MDQFGQSVIWLNDGEVQLRPDLSDHVRGLYRLGTAKFPVSPGFIIDRQVYSHYLAETKLDSFISKRLATVDRQNNRQLAAASRAIRDKMSATPLPLAIRKQLEDLFEIFTTAQNGSCLMTVSRASLPSHSQADSSIAQTKAALVRAVHQSFSSLFELNNLTCWFERKFELNQLPADLLVVAKYPAIVSGRLFIAQEGRSDQLIVEALYGESQPLTQGHIKPDHYTIDLTTGAILARDLNKQLWKEEWTGRTYKQTKVPRIDQVSQKLSDDALSALSRLAEQLKPQLVGTSEVWWSLDEQHRLWIEKVSSLPATATPPAKPSDLKGQSIVPGHAHGPLRRLKKIADQKNVVDGDIIIVERPQLASDQILEQAAGIILQGGNAHHPTALKAREQGVPTIITSQDADHLPEGLLTTLDAHSGNLYRGRVNRQNGGACSSCLAGSQHLVTGTRIYTTYQPGQPIDITSDGIGLLPAEAIIAATQEHPRNFVKTDRSKTLSGIISIKLEETAQALFPKPVIYQLNNLTSSSQQSLLGGENFEINEANPLLGYRGALRHLREPDILKIELNALRATRDAGYTNIHLSLPHVRTYKEFAQLYHMIVGTGLKPGHDLQVWFNCQLPSSLFFLEKLCQEELIQGIIVDVAMLSQLLLGVDADNPLLDSEYGHRNEATEAVMSQLAAIGHSYSLPVIGIVDGILAEPELIDLFIENGYTGLVVDTESTDAVRRLVASAEQRLLVNRAVEDLHMTAQ